VYQEQLHGNHKNSYQPHLYGGVFELIPDKARRVATKRRLTSLNSYTGLGWDIKTFCSVRSEACVRAQTPAFPAGARVRKTLSSARKSKFSDSLTRRLLHAKHSLHSGERL